LAVGEDDRIIKLSSIIPFPSSNIRQLYIQSALTNGILRNGNVSALGNATITQGFRIMPKVVSDTYNFDMNNYLGDWLYPLGVSFLLPYFVTSLVREKEEQIFVLMRMNGLHTETYYLSHCITFFILYAIASLLFILAGLAGGLSLFTKTNALVLIIMFLLWGFAQISLAFLISSLFQKAKTAYNLSTIIVIISVISFLAIQFESLPSHLWAPFAFYRALLIANKSSYEPNRLVILFKLIFLIRPLLMHNIALEC
jgi:hypothetical protein